MTDAYALLKLVHQTAVAVSITGFVARGAGALAGAAWVRGAVAQRLPHAVDSVLLLSALALAGLARLNPSEQPWLAAKMAGLVLYIALGVAALKPALPKPVRALAWLGAITVFGWIVSVAVTKRPAGFLAGLA